MTQRDTVRGNIDSSMAGAMVNLAVRVPGKVTTYKGVVLLDDRSQLLDTWIKARDYVDWWNMRPDRPRLQIVEFWVNGQSRTSYAEVDAIVEVGMTFPWMAFP